MLHLKPAAVVVLLAAAFVLMAGRCGPPPLPTVTVGAASGMSLAPFGNSAAYTANPSPADVMLQAAAAPIGGRLQRMRIGRYAWDFANLSLGWINPIKASRVDTLAEIAAQGGVPLVQIAGTPPSISSCPIQLCDRVNPTAEDISEASRWAPMHVAQGYPEWRTYVTEVMNQLATIPDPIVVEVWNEPNQFAHFWNSSASDFFALYEATVQAVLAARPTAIVGGVGVSGWAGHFPNDSDTRPVLLRLVEFVNARQLRLDFLSFHSYAKNPWRLSLGDGGQALRDWRDLYWGPSTPMIFQSEGNLDFPPAGSAGLPELDAPQAGAHWVARIQDMIASEVEAYVYFGLLDTEGPPYDGRVGLFTTNRMPKPPLSSVAMLQELPTPVAELTVAQSLRVDLAVVAGRVGDRVGVLVSAPDVPPEHVATFGDQRARHLGQPVAFRLVVDGLAAGVSYDVAQVHITDASNPRIWYFDLLGQGLSESAVRDTLMGRLYDELPVQGRVADVQGRIDLPIILEPFETRRVLVTPAP